MDRDRFENWLRNIYNTQDEEISCTECLYRLSHFVELEISGQSAAAKMPKLNQHLSQCLACRDEYETLRDLRLLEEEGGMPSSGALQGSIK